MPHGKLKSNARMKKRMKKDDWDRQYSAGKWQFLRNPKEQKRLQLIADKVTDLAERYGSVTLVDLGCGEGQLYAWLKPEHVLHYVGVDISEVALEGIVEQEILVTGVCTSLEDFVLTGEAERVVFVASEVLTYNENSVEQLDRIVKGTPQTLASIVSVVGPHDKKPNWTAASKKFWSQMGNLSWPDPEWFKIEDQESGIVWDIASYQF